MPKRVPVRSIGELKRRLSTDVQARSEMILSSIGPIIVQDIQATSLNRVLPEFSVTKPARKKVALRIFVTNEDEVTALAVRKEEHLLGGTRPFATTINKLQSKTNMLQFMRDAGIK
jgi:hypothetical protein